ncbi:MFS transporter [Micromonospora sp. DT233]|uniref:MFS transporter n=1 Tax=Micromonospora sp. DT233 TaxID=3393432 RepID=UPI003CF0219E
MGHPTDVPTTTDRASTPAEPPAGRAPAEVARPAVSSPLIRYLLSACLVRCAQGGATVGLVALTISSGERGGAALAGMLAALLTAPNIAGPWLARWLDSARDGRLVLAGSFTVFGVGLAAGALLLGRAPVLGVAALIALAGLAGPLMTGGLSSRLTGVVGEAPARQRRAEGWDSATYGLAGIVGPALVAAMGALTGPLYPVLALAGTALLGAALVLSMPARAMSTGEPAAAFGVAAALRLLVTVDPLRRVLVATALTSVSAGGIMVVAVVFGTELTGHRSSGPALAVAYGVGSLCGSVAVALLPLRGEPERLAIGLVAANAMAVGSCAAAPNYPLALAAFGLAGVSSAILFTATLAVRSRYSPPGARAQVFVCMAGVKMVAASVGTALAGTLVGVGPRFAMLVGAAVTAVAVAVALVDRRLTRRRAGSPVGGPVG